jgi:hypothetical protein
MEKMTDEEILSKIDNEEQIAYGINDAQLSSERAEAINYYLGEKFGNEVEGRSQVVSYDVQDTIESALPQLLKPFVSGDEVVAFEPKGPEDQAAAEQETDYVNHIVMEKNNGFEIFYVWFKDALLSKNGYVKVYHEEYEEAEEEEYEGLTDAQLDMLASDDNVEILEHETYPDPSVTPMPITPQMVTPPQVERDDGTISIEQESAQAFMQPMLHNVKIRVKEMTGEIKIKNVAPENIMVSVDCSGVDLNTARFVQHRELMSPSEVAEIFDVDEDELNTIMAEQDEFEIESNARDIYSEQYDRAVDTTDILVRDTYLKLDGERHRYVLVGNRIIYKDESCDNVPFACISPMLMPHRHIGRSYTDLTRDIQMIKSTLIRGQLDNMYLSNNGRYAISDRVNLDDMLTSRPGGIVRVQGEPGASIMPLQHAPFPPTSFSMVEYMDNMKEKRTGITAYNQGLDSNSLNKTATGVQQIMSAAQQRLELVARTFAETGVKDLFMLVHRLIRKNVTKPDIVRIRNKWVNIDPREWKNRKDLSISVGLGAGNKDQQLMHINAILQLQEKALQVGLTNPEKIYNALAKLTQNAGFKNPDEFWTNPANMPQGMQQKQPNPQDTLIQGQLAIEQAKAQGDMAIAQQKAQANLQQEQLRSENDVIIEREKIAAQAELERFKAQLKAETDLAIAQIKAQVGM